MKRSWLTRVAVFVGAALCTNAASGRPSAAVETIQVTAACVPDAATLCLEGNRFRVTAGWVSATQSGAGRATALASDTGYFWFFSPTNVEMIVKVLDACVINSHFWVFAGGLTDVQVITTVTDMQTGTQRIYLNPTGTAFQPIQDTSEFACSDGSPAAWI